MPRFATTIEAILYLKAQPLTLAEIAECAQCDRETAEEGLIELMADYAHRDTALEVAETPNGYSLQLREDFQNLVQTMIPADIGKGALRTLAVIALKGPIIQTDLINLRGSTAYDHVRDLVEQGFVRKRRRSDGRSYWLQVTDKFNQYFQLNQLPGQLDQLLGASTSKANKVGGAANFESIETAAAETVEATTELRLDAAHDDDQAGMTDAETADAVVAEQSSEPIAEPVIIGTLSDDVLEQEEALYHSEV
jgi:segregation and condensation protein B